MAGSQKGVERALEKIARRRWLAQGEPKGCKQTATDDIDGQEGQRATRHPGDFCVESALDLMSPQTRKPDEINVTARTANKKD